VTFQSSTISTPAPAILQRIQQHTGRITDHNSVAAVVESVEICAHGNEQYVRMVRKQRTVRCKDGKAVGRQDDGFAGNDRRSAAIVIRSPALQDERPVGRTIALNVFSLAMRRVVATLVEKHN